MNYADSKYNDTNDDHNTQSAPPLEQPQQQQNTVNGVSSDDRIFSLLVHLSPLAGFWLFAPLIIYCIKKDESPFIKYHSAEALNYHITTFILAFCLFIPAVFLSIFIPPLLILIILAAVAAAVASLVFMILAAVAANKGQAYKYPINIRLVK